MPKTVARRSVAGHGPVVGETMGHMATGNDNNPFSSDAPFLDLLVSVKTMTATIAKEMGDTVNSGDHYQVLFLLGVLLSITFIVNLTAHLVTRFKRK